MSIYYCDACKKRIPADAESVDGVFFCKEFSKGEKIGIRSIDDSFYLCASCREKVKATVAELMKKGGK